MTAIVQYRFSAKALAEAKTITEVTEACSWYDGLRKHASTIKDRAAEIEAAEFVIRAERKLGEMMNGARQAGALAKGTQGQFAGQKKGERPGGIKKTRQEQPTLQAAGVDKNRANRARKLAKLKPAEFKDRLDNWHQQVDRSNGRVTATLPEPPRDREATVAKIRANNVSLNEWGALSDDERREYLQPHNFPSEVQFNKQDSSGIEWAQFSWNPVVGCRHDCSYCYARDIAMRYSDAYPHGFEPAFRPYMLNAPRNTLVPEQAATDARFKNVFTCSMADLFGRWVPREWIEAVLTAVRDNPQFNFLFLTKFPKRMSEFSIPSNAWMGTTVDLQVRVANAEAAFARLNADAGIRWLSVEPMLEPLKFDHLNLFNWVVIGGASRSSKTPAFHPPLPWVIDLYSKAKAAGCAVYMKTNLLGNRVLELPFDAPIDGDPTEAPKALHYLGANG